MQLNSQLVLSNQVGVVKIVLIKNFDTREILLSAETIPFLNTNYTVTSCLEKEILEKFHQFDVNTDPNQACQKQRNHEPSQNFGCFLRKSISQKKYFLFWPLSFIPSGRCRLQNQN